jgi:4-hydroxybenzoyl-CoA thioesterase
MSESRTTTHSVAVNFGDCDPAGIVFFPNFSRWMDAASLSFFMQCGVPPWRVLEKTRGIVGTPLLEIHTRFIQSVTYGETIHIETCIEAWHGKAFVQLHRVMRDGELVCEGRETRIFVTRDATGKLKSMAVPDDIRALCRTESPPRTETKP